MKSVISVRPEQSNQSIKNSSNTYSSQFFKKVANLMFTASILLVAPALKAAEVNIASVGDGASARLDFEPKVDLSTITEIIKPVLTQRQGKLSTFDVLTTIQPLKLALERSPEKPSEPNPILNLISSQIVENLGQNLGLEAIIGTSALVPELPTLTAKVYLPNTSDYGFSNDNFVWPARGLLSSRFGWRWGRLHQGIDIAAPIGTPIWAASDGVVDFAGWNNGGYGNMIDILHANGTITRYAHLNTIHVRRGQSVNQAQVIGTMGNTGFSTGPHLHFEIRPNGRSAIDPMVLLARANPNR